MWTKNQTCLTICPQRNPVYTGSWHSHLRKFTTYYTWVAPPSPSSFPSLSHNYKNAAPYYSCARREKRFLSSANCSVMYCFAKVFIIPNMLAFSLLYSCERAYAHKFKIQVFFFLKKNCLKSSSQKDQTDPCDDQGWSYITINPKQREDPRGAS